MRSDVAIPRCASPERDAPDAFGALQAPARESGGAFLPTARLDGPFNLDQHRRTGGLPLKGEPHPADACPFSTDPRPPYPPRRWAGPALAGSPTVRGYSPAPCSLPSAGRQVFLRRTRPSTSTTPGTVATALKSSTPGSPPWEGPQPPSDPSRSSERPDKRGRALEAGSDAFAYCQKIDKIRPWGQWHRPLQGQDFCAWNLQSRTILGQLIHRFVHKGARH